jgi:hypothetical protein
MNLKLLTLSAGIVLSQIAFQLPANADGFKLGQLFEAKPIDLTADPAPTAEKAVKCESMKKLKGVNKVVITSFNVQFVTARKANAHAGGGSDHGASYVHSDVTLKGLDDTNFQAITEAAYTNFVAQLKDMGLEVMPYAEYAALPEYEKMKSCFYTSPKEDDALFSGMPTRIFAPAGMPVVFYGDEESVSPTARMGATASMSGHAPKVMEPKIAKESGVPAIHVFLLVDFAQVKTSGGTFSSTASVQTKPQLAIGRQSHAAFVFDGSLGGPQIVKLANYAYGNDNYIDAYKDVTTTTQLVGDAAANVIGVLGGGGVHKTRSYEADADPAAYQAISVKYLGAVTRLWLDAVKANMGK